MTISPAIRIVALVGLLGALGLGAFTFLVLGHKSTPTVIATPPHQSRTTSTHTGDTAHTARTAHTATHSAAHPVTHHASVATAVPTDFPSIRHALAYHSVVVAVVYAPGFAAENGLVAAAQAGAKAAHAGFTVIDVRKEKAAEALAASYPYASDPSVLIFTRPGTVVTDLDGVQDSQAVAQAALDARP
jgi:cytoskeletal protein RodZ